MIFLWGCPEILFGQQLNSEVFDKFHEQFQGSSSDSAFLMSLKDKEIRQIEKLVNKRIKAKPNYYDGFLFLGFLKAQENQWNEAIKLLDKALGIEANDPDLYFMKGNIYLEQEMYQEALLNYKLTLKKDPEYTNALNNIAVLRIRNQGTGGLHQNDLKLAKSDILEIFEIDSTTNERVMMNIGLIHIGLFEHQSAQHYFTRIIDMDESLLPEAYFNRGLSLYYQRDYSLALEDFAQCKVLGFDSTRASEFINHIQYILDSSSK